MKVLVVDDSVSTLTIISHVIEKIHDFKVVGYSDPTLVVESLDHIQFDIAVIDYLMPGLDGPDLMKTIRAKPRFQNVPILVLTSNDDRETRLNSLSNGAIDFITKPIEPIEFSTRLENIAKLRAAQLLLEDESRLLSFQVETQTRKLLEREQDIVDIVIKTAGFRDNDVGYHSLRVGKYAGIISQELGLSDEFCKDIVIAAQMHDIGKVAISDKVLKKNTQFDQADMVEMRHHTVAGHQILGGSNSKLLKMAASIAHFHHEKWDGTGYPTGRTKTEIPIEARIVSLADTFDALANKRRYKSAWASDVVLEHIGKESGTSFDPEVVGAFMNCFTEIREVQLSYSDKEQAIEKPLVDSEVAA